MEGRKDGWGQKGDGKRKRMKAGSEKGRKESLRKEGSREEEEQKRSKQANNAIRLCLISHLERMSHSFTWV